MKEEWKPLFGFENTYEASTLGRIRRSGGQHKGVVVGRILKPWLSTSGYLTVYLCATAGNPKPKQVHRLIAATFIGPSHLPINHKNGIKTENQVSNLEYTTPKRNSAHITALRGDSPRRYDKRKLNRQSAHQIRQLASELTVRELSDQFGVHIRTIQSVVAGHSWR